MTNFEKAAKKMEKEHGTPRPSYDHTIDTYTANERHDQTQDWIMTVIVSVIIGAAALIIFDFFGGADWLLTKFM